MSYSKFGFNYPRLYGLAFFLSLLFAIPAVGDNVSDNPAQIPANRSENQTAAALSADAQPNLPAPSTSPPGVRFTLALDAGMREDNLDWSIAGDSSGSNPNILSELTWKNLRSYQVRLTSRMDIHDRFRISAALARGLIYEGENQDSDYLGDNRTLEWSRSNNASDDGQVWDFSLGLGPRFDFGLDYFALVPMLGFSYHVQKLTMSDGHQTIPPNGVFSGLDSTYDTEWQGPWLGISLELNAKQPLWFFQGVVFDLTFQYHWVDYEAEADWNLRETFAHPKSFEHKAYGYGMVYGLGATFFLSDRWSLALAFDYSEWETDNGTDRVFFSDGSSGTTQLNRVRWYAKTLSLGIAYHF
jgi:hypothetical protein